MEYTFWFQRQPWERKGRPSCCPHDCSEIGWVKAHTGAQHHSEVLVLRASHPRSTGIVIGRGLLISSFPFTACSSPSTAVLFPTVLKISRFVLNVKNYLGFSTSLGADYSTSKLISLSGSSVLSYFHAINFSVAAWTNPSHPLCVQPSDACKWPWLSRRQGFYVGSSILLTKMRCKLAQMSTPFVPCTKFNTSLQTWKYSFYTLSWKSFSLSVPLVVSVAFSCCSVRNYGWDAGWQVALSQSFKKISKISYLGILNTTLGCKTSIEWSF